VSYQGSAEERLRLLLERRELLIAALETAVSAHDDTLDELGSAHRAGIAYALRMVRQYLDVDGDLDDAGGRR
jgi:hypothetical protein